MKYLSPHPVRYYDLEICEDDLHARQKREGNMKFHDMATKSIVGVIMGLNQENVK